ncbi:MAG: hypothetical protein M0024_01145 [Nitrospiraceae bacterium]|nr:hypothetical protein [Nitrospiraceae bacterium]
MVLELNDREKETLRSVLATYEKDLKGEIRKTDDRELRGVLHTEDDILRGILRKVA